jgi:ABC-type branched-subunit amino acid transport system permease subunit
VNSEVDSFLAPHHPVANPERERRRPSRRLILEIGALAAALAALWLLPLVLDSRSVSLMSRYLLFGIAALGLDLLWGKAGLLSFGHAAMFGLGAYASALLLAKTEWAAQLPLLVIAAAILISALFGLVSGVVLFYGRVKGVYFGIVTLLATLLLEQLATTWTGLTGGSNGLLVPTGLTLGPLQMVEPSETYRIVLVIAAGTLLATRWFTRTPFGQAVEASRMNDTRAEALGYDVAMLRAVTMAIAGGLGGLAGALYAPIEGFVYPAQLDLAMSTGFIVWVAIGGRGTLVGAFVGAVLVNAVQTQLSSQVQDYWPLIIGVILLVVIMFQPAGIVGALRRVGRGRGQ